MAIGKADALKGARLGIKKKKEEEDDSTYDDSLSDGAKDIAAAEQAEAEQAKQEAEQAKQEADLKERQGIAAGLKNLSKEDKLTTGLFNQAKDRATKAGVTDEQFESFLDENKIAKPASSKEEAAQNVMYQREFGTGLGTLKAMQDPKYELGSGSALRQPARPIGPESGKYRRAARRLRRQGYGQAAQQMAMQGEMARLGEPAIDTKELRAARMSQRILAGKEAQKQDKLAAGMAGDAGMSGKEGVAGPEGKNGAIKKARKRKSAVEQNNSDFDKRRKQAKKDRQMRTLEFRDRNQNGVDDRDEDDGLDEITYYKPFQNL